ncbi:DUF1513 domain-containing protein [Oryzibacter oryziterrae]|uniref:DUF1513 domain-containing protein n=1 Tax=Oryzibacter oryziterrae TaxID=2766474 RepID=UPI001F1984DE|nr:DUF1513 domain-containing protein [Oryzibacter oryziterrae]
MTGSFAPSRRAFLSLAGGGWLAATLGTPVVYASETTGETLFASCAKLKDDSFAVALVALDGTVRALHPLPDRGHDVAFDPVAGLCVAFARRPGTFAVIFDVAGQREPQVITSPKGRHFYGHGVFTADGSRLYATENDYDRGVGVIGIYDVRQGFKRIGEFDTGGVGSHELIWMADGRTLAIANGGLDTTADFGRTNLNVADMKASLTFVDPDAQKVIDTQVLDRQWNALSIRHLALDRTGAVWFGCQYEGDPSDLPPLLGRTQPGRTAELIDIPEDIMALPKNYIGSVAASGDGGAVVFSSPKGGIAFAFEAGSARFLGDVRLDDVCGMAPLEAGQLLLSNGAGTLARMTAGATTRLNPCGRDDLAFDNHLARLERFPT